MAEGKLLNTIEREPTQEEYASAVFEDGGALVVNLDNIAEAKFEAIPKGVYDVEVDSCEYKLSQSSGAPMFEMVFRVINNDAYNGRKLFYYISFSPKALSGSKTALLRLDADIFNGPFKPKEIAESGRLLGKQVKARVTIEPYNGEDRSRISQLLPAATGGGGQGGGAFFG